MTRQLICEQCGKVESECKCGDEIKPDYINIIDHPFPSTDPRENFYAVCPGCGKAQARSQKMNMTYSIGEVAKMLNVSTQSLRSWEKHGLIIKCYRRPTGRREYTDEDIKAITEFLKEKQIVALFNGDTNG